MDVTSPSQHRAVADRTVPPLERVRDDVWAFGQAMPSDHIPFSICYLLRDSDGGAHVIDPGSDTDANFVRLTDALTDAAADGIRSIIVTHLHPDHLGMAERVRREFGAPVMLLQPEQRAIDAAAAEVWTDDRVEAELDRWGVPATRRPELEAVAARASGRPRIAADVLIADDDQLAVPGFDLRAMWTPGHTLGHLCLRDDDRRLLFTGDHLLPVIYPGLGLGGPGETNPLRDYFESLDRVSQYTDYEVLPGHGYRFTGVAERAAETREHHLRRSREVAAVLAEGANPTTWQIAERLTWTAGWQNLNGFFLYSALSQTAMHREYLELASR